MAQQQLRKSWFLKLNSKIDFFYLICSLILICSSSCGPKIITAKLSDEVRLRSVVILPASTNADIAREKVDQVQELFSQKLASKGFQQISEQKRKDFCAKSDCTNLSVLAKGLDADVVAKIEVTSTNSTNLLAGNSQSISGKGAFFDPSGKEIASVEHTETERGGLLFNSGQLLQGIKSTVNSFGDESFNNLSDKFVDTIVSKLPAPKGNLELTDLKIGQSSIKALGSGRYLACVESPNAQSAFIHKDNADIPFRLTKAGNFCGSFLLDPTFNMKQWTLNVSGRYGETKSIPLDQVPSSECFSEKSINKLNETIIYSAKDPSCAGVNFLVFTAPNAYGPYALKARLNTPGSAAAIKKENSSAIAVVGVSEKLGNSKLFLLN